MRKLFQFIKQQKGRHFEEAPFFYVCETFPQHIMHIFHDKLLVNKLKFFIKYYINEESKFTLQNLNK